MELIEKAIRKAAEKSQSLKKLVDLQDAYIHATKTMHASDDYADTLVRQACQDAIRYHAVLTAESLNADANLIKRLREDECFPWHEMTYIFVEKIPAISELIAKEIEG